MLESVLKDTKFLLTMEGLGIPMEQIETQKLFMERLQKNRLAPGELEDQYRIEYNLDPRDVLLFAKSVKNAVKRCLSYEKLVKVDQALNSKDIRGEVKSCAVGGNNGLL